MTHDIAAKLADGRVFTRDDLAELAVDELVDLTALAESEASELIMKARAHWFAEEGGETQDGR